MKKKAALTAMLLTLFCAGVYSAVVVQNVMSDMGSPANLTDGSYQTTSRGKPGTNVIFLQFGQTRYVSKARISAAADLNLNFVEVYVSDDFVEWKKVFETRSFRGKVLDATLTGANAPFMKIVLYSTAAFDLQEVECFSGELPANRITDVRVTGVTETSATITWKTALKTLDYFYYMKKYNGSQETVVQAEYMTEHTVQLSGLLTGSEYVYRIVSESPDGTRVESDQLSFTTRGVPLPEFWELRAVNITPFTARISFRANVPVRYEVYLSTDSGSLTKVKQEDNYKDVREFELLGLQPEKRYFYKIVIQDKQGRVLQTTPLEFYTPANNVALGKRIWGTFGFVDTEIQGLGYGTTSEARIVDGDLNYFTGSAVSFNADNADQYVIIDLGKEYQFKAVDVYWWGLAYSRDYRVDLSHDGFNWETMREHIDGNAGEEMRSPGGDLLVYQRVAMVKQARFVRLYMTAGSKRGTRAEMFGLVPYFRLCEIAVIENL